MKTTVGLWLDHRKAVIVSISDLGETAKLIISRVEKQLGRPGGIRSTTPYEPLQVPSDDRRQRKLTGQLNSSNRLDFSAFGDPSKGASGYTSSTSSRSNAVDKLLLPSVLLKPLS